MVNPKDIPINIRMKITEALEHVKNNAYKATELQTTQMSKGFYFRFKHNSDSNILNDIERAQSVSFIAKYDSIPIPENLEIVEENGRYHIKNLNEYRHIISEYRPIIYNQNDLIYYKNIHKFCRDKLLNIDPNSGLSLSVIDQDGIDITSVFLGVLNQRYKSIKYILNHSDYDFLYNGILQHSDQRHTERYWDEYVSGKLNYTFIIHSHYIGLIKDFLKWHYNIINQVTFPKLGSL